MNSENPYIAGDSVSDISDIEVDEEYSTANFWGFKGRLGRVRYLVYASVVHSVLTYFFFIFEFVISAINKATFDPAADFNPGLSLGGLNSVSGIIAAVIYIAISVCFFSLMIRRSRDIGWSGWFSLLYLIPIVGFFYPLVILFVPGNIGENRFGKETPPNGNLLVGLAVILPALYIISTSIFYYMVFNGLMF